MEKLLIAASIGLGLASGSALAADTPVKPAPGSEAPSPYTWTGCYINGGLGYGMWKQDHHGEELTPLTPLTPTISTGGEPWVGTVGAGCDYQVGSRWLIGGFLDYDIVSVIYGGSFQESYLGWIGNETAHGAWAVGGRIGYLVTPTLLTYINAGYTQARFGQINLFTPTVPQVPPAACGVGPCLIPANSDGGWFIGGGTEFALWDVVPVHGLFWRTDYRYAVYSSADLPILTSTGAPVTATCAVVCGEHLRKDVQSVTTGLVWRFFDFDAPPSGSGFAAGMPVKAAPEAGHAAYTWTSCYINWGAGYGTWEQNHYTDDKPLQTGSTGGEGWAARVGVGCDYQVVSRVVLGVVADYDFMHLSGSFKDPFLGYIGDQTETSAWGVGIRAGYLVTPKLLTYLDFGYPWAHFDRINLLSGSPSPAQTPYFYPARTISLVNLPYFGAGTEYALGDIVPLGGLFWRTEYRYIDYSIHHFPLLTTAAHSTNTCMHCSLAMNKDVQTVISGFVWRFSGGP
jgi:outer membrane immunogenic protein